MIAVGSWKLPKARSRSCLNKATRSHRNHSMPTLPSPALRNNPAMQKESLKETLEAGCKRIDEALHRLIPSADAYPQSIHQAMRHSVFAGGKRIRPILGLDAARAVARDAQHPSGVEDLGPVLEKLHTYSLVHRHLPAQDNGVQVRRNAPVDKRGGQVAARL